MPKFTATKMAIMGVEVFDILSNIIWEILFFLMSGLELENSIIINVQ